MPAKVRPASPQEAKVRLATGKDRDLLVSFHHALYAVHRKDMIPSEEWILSSYKDLASVLRDDVDAILARPACTALIAELDGRPVGYVTGRVEQDNRRSLATRGVIEDWYVEVASRGAGVGRKLLDALLSRFREQGCLVAESTTWPGNSLAKRAHQQAGFIEVETKFRRKL